MKKIWIILGIVLIFLTITYFGCSDPAAPLTVQTEVLKEGLAKEVFPGVFDNEKGTVFIHFNLNDNEYNLAADFFTKKDSWQKMFPQKRIVAMTDILSGLGQSNGIIIHYIIEE